MSGVNNKLTIDPSKEKLTTGSPVKNRERADILEFEFQHAVLGYLGDETLLHDLTLKLSANRVYWIKGASGQGRTTLLKTLAGLVEPLDGQLLINGVNVYEMTFEEFNFYRSNIGFGFSHPILLSNRTLQENLQLPILYHWDCSPEIANEKIRGLAKRFYFLKYLHMRPSSVPASVQKIVCVLRAFMRDPQVVLLDDPLALLSVEIQNEFAKYISEKIATKAIRAAFIVTDDQSLMSRLTPVELVIEDGAIRVDESHEDRKTKIRAVGQ